MTMPNFFIIGAMKAGTTALYQYLKQHPQIYMSPNKEPNFFAFEGEKLDFRAPVDRRGINQTSVTDIEAYRALFSGVSDEIAIGEASHWYLYSTKAAKRIRHHVPEAKLIAVLRNPVERAYSEFMHFVRDGDEPIVDFSQALAQEPQRIRDNWTMGRYVDRGFYYAQLKRYYDTFDPGQIRVYLYEDLNADPVSVTQELFQFLEVDKTFVPNVSIRSNVSGVPKSKLLHTLLTRPQRVKQGLKLVLPGGVLQWASDIRTRNLDRPQIAPEVRRRLIQTYREDILKLQTFIRRDISKWLEDRA